MCEVMAKHNFKCEHYKLQVNIKKDGVAFMTLKVCARTYMLARFVPRLRLLMATAQGTIQSSILRQASGSSAASR